MAGTWFAILGCSLIALAFGITGLVRLVVLLRLSNGISATGRVVRLEPGPLYTWMDGQPPYTPIAEFEAGRIFTREVRPKLVELLAVELCCDFRLRV